MARRVPAIYGVEEWDNAWAVVRDGLDLRDRRETPRRRLAVVALYADELVAVQVAFLLNTQRGHEVDP